MAARSGQWKRRWVEPTVRCHGGSKCCCITRSIKSGVVKDPRDRERERIAREEIQEA